MCIRDRLTQWLQEAMGEELADLRKDTVARLLGQYEDWRDCTLWPQVPGSQNLPTKLAVKQGDPEAKKDVYKRQHRGPPAGQGGQQPPGPADA